MRAHLAVNHFKNFLVNEIKTSIKQYPYCPFQNCDFLAEKMAIVVEHFNVSHKPEVCDFDSVTEILCRKCSKCFLGPFESQDDLLTHIGTAHGEMVDVWVNKLTLTKTLEPLKKVIRISMTFQDLRLIRKSENLFRILKWMMHLWFEKWNGFSIISK